VGRYDNFDRGIAVLSEPRGAPRLHWGWNPLDDIKQAAGAVKDGVVGAGHFVGQAASNPWVQGLTAAGLAATGVGAPAAAAIMAAERGGGALLQPGGNIGDAVKGGLEGAAMGGAASAAGSAIHGGGGLLSKAGSLYGAGKTALGIGGNTAGLPSGAPSDGPTAPSVGTPNGSDVPGPAGLSPAVMALVGAQGVNAAQLGAKANDFADRAWTNANAPYEAKAPLRASGISALQNPSFTAPTSQGNLSGIMNQNPNAARAAGLPSAPQQVTPFAPPAGPPPVAGPA
jgi:hypothetical protein